jgi:hypothetical protein
MWHKINVLFEKDVEKLTEENNVDDDDDKVQAAGVAEASCEKVGGMNNNR